MSGDRGVIVVGAGQAAGRAAKAMRGAGYAGPITIFGDEPHLPYERPVLSKGGLMEARAAAPQVLGDADCASLDIAVRTATAVAAIDRTAHEVVLENGERAGYDKLLIATGGKVRRLSIAGVAPEAIFYLRTIDDAERIGERLRGRPDMVVVGGGFIGLEVAASAAKLGCRVTVVEAADRLLPRLGCPDASAYVLAHHRAAGIDIRLGTHVVRGDGDRLILSDGAPIPAGLIVAGIGVAPDTALAETAGLACDDGILVDEYGRTSDPAIFAAGDVTRHYHPLLGRRIRLESWQNANVQAEAAGRTIAGEPTVAAEIPWLWSDQGDLNLQMAGAPEAIDATVVRRGDGDAEGIAVFQLSGGRLVGGVTLNRGKDMPLIRRMLTHGALTPDPAALADPAVPLRRLIPAREAA